MSIPVGQGGGKGNGGEVNGSIWDFVGGAVVGKVEQINNKFIFITFRLPG